MSRTNSSTTLPTPPTQPLADLLLVNLRLLDLDTLNDFPEINSKTFSSKDSKSRIRSTEWVLYRLFELWDPEQTTDVSTKRSQCPLRRVLTVILRRNYALSSHLSNRCSHSIYGAHCFAPSTSSRRMGFSEGNLSSARRCLTNARETSLWSCLLFSPLLCCEEQRLRLDVPTAPCPIDSLQPLY